MLLESLEALEALHVLPFVVDEEAGVALPPSPGGHLGVEPLSSPNDRGENRDRAFANLGSNWATFAAANVNEELKRAGANTIFVVKNG